MNIPWICRPTGARAALSLARNLPHHCWKPARILTHTSGLSRGIWPRIPPLTPRRFTPWVLVGLAGTLLPGCGYTQGKILYFLGVGSAEKVEAKFQLTESPVLILVDDPSGRMDWPAAGQLLFDQLAQELLQNKAAKKVIPRETVAHLRQSVPGFEKRGCREIGELAGADQVLWLQVQDFVAEPHIQDITVAAYFSVAVKVVNVVEKGSRTRVRLWPTSPRGHLVAVTMDGGEVSIAKTKNAIAKELASRLAVDVARLFYKHELDDFGH